MLKEDTDRKKYTRFNSDKGTWSLFYFLILLTFLLVNISPKATEIKEVTDGNCILKIYEELGYPCLPFDYEENPIYTVEVNPKKIIPFSVLTARPRRRMSMAASSVVLKAEISLYVVNKDGEIVDRVYRKQSVSHSLKCNDKTVNCDSMELGSAQNLNEDRYIFVVNFFNIDRVRAAHISEVDLFFINSSLDYSQKLTYLRFLLLICAGYLTFKLAGVKRPEKQINDDLSDLIKLGASLILLNNPLSSFAYVGGSIFFTVIGNFGIALSGTYLLIYLEALSNKIGRTSSGRGFKTLCFIFFIFMLGSTRKTFEHHTEAQSILTNKWLDKFFGLADVIGTLLKLTSFIFVLRKYLSIIKEPNILPKERTTLVISSFFLIIFMVMSFTDCLMIDVFSSTKNIYLVCFINFYFFLMARIKIQDEENLQSIGFKKVDINVEDGKNV